VGEICEGGRRTGGEDGGRLWVAVDDRAGLSVWAELTDDMLAASAADKGRQRKIHINHIGLA
jgi:hypothetical protein